ncbi:MAG: TlpA family protein disulfide reductase [Flavobacteriales bacterium]|nr:TlpA family protein disulfide reductase [Flavobacteriales bacterium]
MKLEELLEGNRDHLNQLEPKNSSWASIESTLSTPASRKFNVFKLIAGIALLIGLGSLSIFLQKEKTQDLSQITLNTPNGDPVNLGEIYKKNQVTLVQFWASWSAVCTQENCYYFKPIYEKYNKKGFEIYAISLDSSHSTWYTQISKDTLPWIHVSDLKGYESPVCVECQVDQVPTNFLLDSEGGVLAKNVNVQTLEETLFSLLE